MTKRIFFCLVTLYTCISLIVLGLNVLFSRGHQSIEQSASPIFKWTTLQAAILIAALLIAFRKNIVAVVDKVNPRYACIGLLLISCFLQAAAIFLFRVNPSWDYGVIIRSATAVAEGGSPASYFINYPNNLFIMILLASIGKIFVPSLATYLLFNVLIMTLSQYLIYRIACKLAGQSIGILALAASVVFLPYILYAPIVYTDTLSLFFLLLPLNLILDQRGRMTERMSVILAASVLFALGTIMKGLLVIFVIAFGITLLICCTKWKKGYVVIPFITLLVLQPLFNSAVEESGLVDRNQIDRYSFPVTHWLVMGQNQPHYGKYLRDDVDWTTHLLQTMPRHQVQQKHLEELKKRVAERGAAGNMRFYMEKLNQTWTDGTYYTLNVLKRKPVHPEHVDLLLHGPISFIVQGYARIQLIVTLIGLLLAVRLNRKPDAFLTFAMLSMIGFFLFLILWETRSRYLVSLSPLLILLSSCGYFGDRQSNGTPGSQTIQGEGRIL